MITDNGTIREMSEEDSPFLQPNYRIRRIREPIAIDADYNEVVCLIQSQ